MWGPYSTLWHSLSLKLKELWSSQKKLEYKKSTKIKTSSRRDISLITNRFHVFWFFWDCDRAVISGVETDCPEGRKRKNNSYPTQPLKIKSKMANVWQSITCFYFLQGKSKNQTTTIFFIVKNQNKTIKSCKRAREQCQCFGDTSHYFTLILFILVFLFLHELHWNKGLRNGEFYEILHLQILFLTPVIVCFYFSTTKVFKNPHWPNRRARRRGILYLPSHGRSTAEDCVEQEGEESQQPEIWGIRSIVLM